MVNGLGDRVVNTVLDFLFGTANAQQTSTTSPVWPTNHRDVTSPYSRGRVDPVSGNTTRPHTAIDIKNPNGDPVYSILAGTVVDVGYSPSAGNFIKIDHGNGLESSSSHTSSTVSVAIFRGRVNPLYTVVGAGPVIGLISEDGGHMGNAGGGTSAVSKGAIAIVVLLPGGRGSGPNQSPVGRGAPSFVLRAILTSQLDRAGLPIFVIAPRGYPTTALLVEAIFDCDCDIIAVVDEVAFR